VIALALDWPVVTAMIAVAGVFANSWQQEQARKRLAVDLESRVDHLASVVGKMVPDLNTLMEERDEKNGGES